MKQCMAHSILHPLSASAVVLRPGAIDRCTVLSRVNKALAIKSCRKYTDKPKAADHTPVDDMNTAIAFLNCCSLEAGQETYDRKGRK